VLITIGGVGVNKVIHIPLSVPPLAWGYTPLPSRIPPYILSECQLGGIIPSITGNKILGKKCPFFPSCIFVENTTPLLKKVLYSEKKFLENFSEITIIVI
jgi:hypothetical protein